MLGSYPRTRSLPKHETTIINVIAVYIITVLIRTSAKFESHYNISAVSCYLDHFFSESFKIQVGSTRV